MAGNFLSLILPHCSTEKRQNLHKSAAPRHLCCRGAVRKKEEKTRSSDSGVSLDAPGGQITGRLHEQYAAAIEGQRADDVHPEEERQIRCKSCAVDAGDGQVGKAHTPCIFVRLMTVRKGS